MHTTQKIAPVILGSVFALVGCGEQASDSGDVAKNQSGQTTQASWMLADAPADPVEVAVAKENAAEGEEIVIKGRIGGRKTPITEGSPVFTIVDLELPHCGQIPGDTCATPWDYCCETSESLTANTATIQIASGDEVAGVLEPLDLVIVRGTVAPRPNEDVLTVKASGVHVVDE